VNGPGLRDRRWFVLAWACSAGLIGGALPSAAAGRAPFTTAGARAAQAGAPDARLTVDNASPRQRLGVLFNASTSSGAGPLVSYSFDYGDGSFATTYQPLTMHAYRSVGTYQARVVVTDALGRSAVSAAVRLDVRDGIPPTVRIDRPRANGLVHLGGRGRLFSGRVSDVSGVRRVELAMSLLSARGARARSAAAKCAWYNGVRSLRVRSCASPLFFRAQLSRGRWRFMIPSGARIPLGAYSLRVRALDRAGNRSSILSLRLRTIIGVRVVG
jgi:hypothetical protein